MLGTRKRNAESPAVKWRLSFYLNTNNPQQSAVFIEEKRKFSSTRDSSECHLLT